MPCKFSMILYELFEDFRHSNYYRRGKHQATRVEGVPTHPGCAPLSRGPMVAPSTYSCTHTLHLPPKKIPIQLKHEF